MVKNSFFITTMGCQMNEYDSDHLAQILINNGYTPTNDPGQANVIIINTCTVREKAEHKALSSLGRMSDLKCKNPSLIIGLAGCLAQQKGAELLRRFPQLDFVMGPREIAGIMDTLKKLALSRKKIAITCLDRNLPQTTITNGFHKGKISAFISIMEGCNNFCSYCIVPYVRGREICRSHTDILSNAQNLIREGVCEITLLGQNVNSYTWENGKKGHFSSILKDLNRLPGLLRLRFTTSHPKDLSQNLIDCFGSLEKLCPHIHLPFQAGSNTILKRMRRGYTREHYLDLLAKLREVVPEIAITSDVMVGFPGETREDFELTLDLIEQAQFDGLFSFQYSDRKDTLSYKMNNKISKIEKSRRLAILQELQKIITLKKNKNLIGKIVEVLITGQSKRGDQLSGRTDTNKVCNFTCDNHKLSGLVNVLVKQGFLNSIQGEAMI